MSIELDDTRVSAMRQHVMADVTQDATARGRRLRRGLVGGGATLALAGVLALTIPTASGPLATPTTADSPVAGVAPEVLSDGKCVNCAQNDAADQAERELVTTGSADVTVDDPTVAAAAFSDWVQAHDGRVDSQSEGTGGDDSAALVARLPATYVDAAISELRDLGTVGQVVIERRDVTAQGADFDARIKALTISIQRLQGILARSTSTSQVIEAEAALTDRQQQLESLQAERRSLSGQVELASLSVGFAQREQAGAVAGDGFFGGLVTGWNALVATVNAIVTALGALAPWLGLAALIAVGWWLVRRARRPNH